MTLVVLIVAGLLFILHLEIKSKQRRSDSQELQDSDDDVS